LAGQLGAEITLVYVNELAQTSQGDPDQSYLQKIAGSVKEMATRYTSKTGTTPPIQAKSVILSGHPAEKIVEYADTENIGLIVMSTHGRSGVKRWALGSVADKVMRAATKPVMLIRAKGSRTDIQKEGLLTKMVDGSKEAEAVIPYIEELALRLKLEIILVQVLARGYQTLDNYFPLSDQQIESDKATASLVSHIWPYNDASRDVTANPALTLALILFHGERRQTGRTHRTLGYCKPISKTYD
jgi:nucleotide-binding universal stress UspA family protein